MSVPTRGLYARRTGPIGCVAFNQRSTRGRGFLHPGAYCDWVNESPCPNPRGERCPPCCRAMAPDAFRAPLARRRRGPERPFRRSATLVVGRACSPQAAGERQPSLACLSGARGAVLSEATQHHASRSHVQQRTGLSLDRSRGRVSLGGTYRNFSLEGEPCPSAYSCNFVMSYKLFSFRLVKRFPQEGRRLSSSSHF